METQYWTKVKEFHGVELLRNPETFECRILPIERPQPQQTVTPVYSPAAIEATEKAVALYKLMQKSKVTTSTHVIEPEPKPVLSFEEQIQHDWRHSPSLRKEFTSFGSYQAYMRAAESGRCRVYGV